MDKVKKIKEGVFEVETIVPETIVKRTIDVKFLLKKKEVLQKTLKEVELELKLVEKIK